MKRLVMKKKLSIVLIMAMMFTMMASFQYVDADAAPTVTSPPSPQQEQIQPIGYSPPFPMLIRH